MNQRIKLRLVPPPSARPLGPLSRAEKLANAKAFLKERGRYILDRGTPKPSWGIPGDSTARKFSISQRGVPTFLERIGEIVGELWRGR